MNGVEERIRRGCPTGSQRSMPLTDRAERELATLLSEADKPAAGVTLLTETDSDQHAAAKISAKTTPRRLHRWVLVACLAAVAGVVGYQLVSDLGAPPVAEQESAEEESAESGDAPMADYPVYHSVEDALTQSSLVVVGVPLDWEAREDDGLHFTVSTFEVNQTLYGPDREGEVIEVRQSSSPDDPGSSISEYYVHLEDVESEEILLFLSDSTADMYTPINPMDGIHAVDNSGISSVQSNVIELPAALDELREQIHHYEDTESQH